MNRISLLIIFIISTTIVFSQPIAENKVVHSINLEGGGTGVVYSIKYDYLRDLSFHNFKLAGGIGFSYFKNEYTGHLSYPSHVSILYGRSIMAETGILITYGTWYVTTYLGRNFKDNNLQLNPFIGIRFQEIRKGVNVRLGGYFTNDYTYLRRIEKHLSIDLNIVDDKWRILPYISVGYNFKASGRKE